MQFTEEIQQTLLQFKAQGKTYTQCVFLLAGELGYSLPVAHRITEAVWNLEGNQRRIFHLPPSAPQPCPDINTQDSDATIALSDRKISIAFEQIAPRIVLLDGFLSDAECDALCASAGTFQASVVMSGNDAASEVNRAIRTSMSASLNTGKSIVQTVQKRAAELFNWPLHQCEALQIQRYLPGDQYQPHYDYFQPGADDFEQIVSRSGQRIATLIMYLNTPERGGDTYFWNLGIKIKARKGSAVFFSYPDASPRGGSFHGGDMVITGEKWIATQWLRSPPVPVSDDTGQ